MTHHITLFIITIVSVIVTGILFQINLEPLGGAFIIVSILLGVAALLSYLNPQGKRGWWE